MDQKELNKKRVMHIDTSGKLYEKGTSGIAYKITGSNLHKGLALSLKLKEGLEKDLKYKDFPRIYVICIYYLLKDSLNFFDVLVICVDERFDLVKKYLEILFRENKDYLAKKVISIHKLRKIKNDKNLISSADNIANSYRKRGLKSRERKQRGIPLNVVEIKLKDIENKWFEIKNYLNYKQESDKS